MLKTRVLVACAGGLAAALAIGGIGVVLPAQAKSGINWGFAWTKQIKPRADHRYYRKSDADARFASRQSLLDDYYTSAQVDATFLRQGALAPYALRSELANYVDFGTLSSYALKQTVLRGTFAVSGTSTAVGQSFVSSFSYGSTLPAAPTVHLIPVGTTGAPTGTLPSGCGGTASAPTASSAELCVFVFPVASGYTRSDCQVVNPATATPTTANAAATFGAGVRVVSSTSAAGPTECHGSWAVGQ